MENGISSRLFEKVKGVPGGSALATVMHRSITKYAQCSKGEKSKQK